MTLPFRPLLERLRALTAGVRWRPGAPALAPIASLLAALRASFGRLPSLPGGLRPWITLATPLGPVRIKWAWLPEGRWRAKAEADDLAALARRHGMALGQLRALVEEALAGAATPQEPEPNHPDPDRPAAGGFGASSDGARRSLP